MIRHFLFIVSLAALPSLSFADSYSAECEKAYAKPEVTTEMGVLRNKSPSQQDMKHCAGRVGASFCIEEKKTEFLANCSKKLKEAKSKKIAEAIEIEEALEKHKAQKKRTEAEKAEKIKDDQQWSSPNP